MNVEWKPGTFLILPGPWSVTGFMSKDLGLWLVVPASPEGPYTEIWSLTHLNTGACICHIVGKLSQVTSIASEIEKCADWSFSGLKGYENSDPELVEKLFLVRDAHPECINGSGIVATDSDDVREVARARA